MYVAEGKGRRKTKVVGIWSPGLWACEESVKRKPCTSPRERGAPKEEGGGNMVTRAMGM